MVIAAVPARASAQNLDSLFLSLVSIRAIEVEGDSILPNGTVEEQVRWGTGFYISRAGLIITALHNIENATARGRDRVWIRRYGEEDLRGVFLVDFFSHLDIAILQDPFDYQGPFVDLRNGGRVEEGAPYFALGIPNAIRRYVDVFAISQGRLLRASANLPGASDQPDRQSVLLGEAPVAGGQSGGLLLDASYRPIGLILGSVTTSERRYSYGRRFRQIRQALKDADISY